MFVDFFLQFSELVSEIKVVRPTPGGKQLEDLKLGACPVDAFENNGDRVSIIRLKCLRLDVVLLEPLLQPVDTNNLLSGSSVARCSVSDGIEECLDRKVTGRINFRQIKRHEQRLLDRFLGGEIKV